MRCVISGAQSASHTRERAMRGNTRSAAWHVIRSSQRAGEKRPYHPYPHLPLWEQKPLGVARECQDGFCSPRGQGRVTLGQIGGLWAALPSTCPPTVCSPARRLHLLTGPLTSWWGPQGPRPSSSYQAHGTQSGGERAWPTPPEPSGLQCKGPRFRSCMPTSLQAHHLGQGWGAWLKAKAKSRCT